MNVWGSILKKDVIKSVAQFLHSLSIQADVAGSRLQNAADHSHQSCFARSICAEQAVDTWHQIDTYIINGAFASILLA